jgi:hypothetical protein
MVAVSKLEDLLTKSLAKGMSIGAKYPLQIWKHPLEIRRMSKRNYLIIPLKTSLTLTLLCITPFELPCLKTTCVSTCKMFCAMM